MRIEIEFIDKGDGDYTTKQYYSNELPLWAVLSILKKSTTAIENRVKEIITEKTRNGETFTEADIEQMTFGDLA